MKHLQAPWKESSAQIAEARTEQNSHQTKMESLREELKKLESECSGLEETVKETQKARASSLRQGIRETASAFSERSAFYVSLHSGDLFSANTITQDKEVIDFYESAKTEATRIALQSPYQKALLNQEERRKAKSLESINAGVVLHKKGEQKLDLYLTAFTGTTGGLADNLTQTIRDTVQASGVPFTESNVEDLLRITVEGNYQGLIEELEKVKPEGFKEANVEYRAVILGESTKPGREKRTKTALQLEEAIPVDKIPEGYIIFDEAVALLGIRSTHCYPFLNSGELASKKYNLPDRANAVRAVEIESLKKLCEKRGRVFSRSCKYSNNSVEAVESSASSIEELSSEQETTYAVLAAETVKGQVLENMVSVPPVSKVTSEPQPNQSQAQKVLGDKMYIDYASRYDSQEVEKVVREVVSCLGEERAAMLLAADVKGLVFKEQNRGRYLGRLNVILSEIDGRYEANVPSDYSFEAKPSNFLPNSLSAIERKLEEAPVSSQPALSDEMALKMDINPVLANRLTAEGYNPAYVHAMIKGGFGIGSSKQYVGEAYFPREYWRGRTKRSLSSLGVRSMDEDEFSRHERAFRQLKLFNEKNKQEHPLAFSPKWSDHTSGALKDYLASIFYPKR